MTTPAVKRGTSDAKPSNNENKIVQGVGDEGFKLPSPSGINKWSRPLQALVVGIYFLVLGTATRGVSGVLEAGLGPHGEHGTALPLVFGSVYALLGSTHFTVPEEFQNIMPPRGTWGIWYLPGSKAFHVAWTGVAEVVLGLGMAGGAALAASNLADGGGRRLESVCAFGLFWLTVGVTPANVFMLTHGARLPRDSGPLPVAFHGVRLAVQSVFLGLLYRIGEETFRALF